jgi:hypothetical protein
MNKKAKQYEQIYRHGENLKKIFELTEAEPIQLSKKLHALELRANRKMVDYCNGDIEEVETYVESELKPKLIRIIGINNMDKIYINRDPRGYTLKLTDEATKEAQDKGINIHRDMGGYGIVAPEFDGE